MKIVSVIRSAYAARMTRNSGYSLRAYARDLGISPAGLSQILSGKQGVSPEKARQLGQRLGLTPAEIESLVLDSTHLFGRSQAVRRVAGQEIERRKRETADQVLTLDFFKVVSDWWHWAILEVAQLEDHISAESLAARAAERLGVPAEELRDSILRLIKLEILSEEPLLKPRRETRLVPAGVPSEAVRRLHSQLLEKAKDALAFQSIDERDFGASFVSIDPGSLPLLKEKIRKFRRDVIEEFGHSSVNPNAQVYFLSTQLIRAEAQGR